MPLLLRSGRDKAAKERLLGQQQPGAHLALPSSTQSAPASEMKRSENPKPSTWRGSGVKAGRVLPENMQRRKPEGKGREDGAQAVCPSSAAPNISYRAFTTDSIRCQ